MNRAPTIAVINSNEDTVDMLRVCLQNHGFSSVVTGHVFNIKTGRMDFLQFLKIHDPAVFVWDISIPYDENWRFLHMLMTSEEMKGRQMVITTTNKRALDSLVGANEAYEIVGKPYDLDQVMKAVKKAAGVE
jgi:DNA-binding NtrC family response regulator